MPQWQRYFRLTSSGKNFGPSFPSATSWSWTTPPPLHVNIRYRTLTLYRLLHACIHPPMLTVWSCSRLFPQASCISLAAASSSIFRDVLIPSSSETDLLCRRCAGLRWRLQWSIPLTRYVIPCALPPSEGVQPTEFDHPPLHSGVTRSSMVCLQTPHPFYSAHLLYSSFCYVWPRPTIRA